MRVRVKVATKYGYFVSDMSPDPPTTREMEDRSRKWGAVFRKFVALGYATVDHVERYYKW